ncbi:unnamed protein product [Auanema sp. JU1783]|nr:unnamed protein product [Auanema sp. JU1783]
MKALIQGTISALGFLEDGNYYQEPDCYESIRDLIRFLKSDTDDCLARRICGERNIVENDLIHIMKAEQGNEKMFDIVLRLIANLIQPTSVSLSGKPPLETADYQLLYKLDENLRRTKSAFADKEFFIILKTRLEKYFLRTEWDDRTEDQKLIMERIVVLMRYIFTIPSGKGDDRRTKLETNTHDKVISAFVESGIVDVLTHIASTSGERDFHLSILQIFGCIVREHSPADIVATFQGRSEEEKAKSEAEMQMIFQTELNKDKIMKRNAMAKRHSRFTGSYVVKGIQAVNKDNDFVVHKVVDDVSKITFNDERKTKKRIAKNRRPFESSDTTHTSSIEVRLQLKSFIEKVLEKAFNVLMKYSKELAFNMRTVLGQKNAETHYFLVMRFFLEYTRLSKRPTSYVSSCLGMEAFHHLQIQLEEALENAASQRKEARHFGMKAQYALAAYKELILIHQHMLDIGNPDEKKLAQRTCEHILKVEEYRDLTAGVMRRFMPGAFSKGFLREIVLSTHFYLRMLEKSVKAGSLTTVNKRQKKRKIRTSGSHNQAPKRSECDKIEGETLDTLWCSISQELSECLMGYVEPATTKSPINSLLDVNDEDHQRFAMLYIQRAMREEDVQAAVGIFRNARDIWNAEGIFGDNNMSPEEEFCELREIFFGDLEEIASALLTAETTSDERFRGNELMNDGEYDSEDEDEATYETKEVNFDFEEYVGKFAKTEILRWYVFLLAEFDRNSFELNKALIKMLHRVSFDLKMPSRLYQLSLFRVFYLVNDKMSKLTPEERKISPLFEIHTFGLHLLKRFFNAFEEIGDRLAPEVLFWKGAKEVYEIEHKFESHYETRETGKFKWPEDLEEEVRSLHKEYMEMEDKPADLDVLDFIEHNMTQPRTRRQIHRKLREQGLETLGSRINKGSAKERSFPIIDLKEFIEKYNANSDLQSEDLVDYLVKSLQENGKGEYSRPKIIKQLAYVGCPYEKKKKLKKVNQPWDSWLETELKSIIEEHKQASERDPFLMNIVDYVFHKIPQKKTRRQVEHRLVGLGIIEEPVRAPRASKPKSAKKKKDDFLAGSDSDNEGEQSSSEDENVYDVDFDKIFPDKTGEEEEEVERMEEDEPKEEEKKILSDITNETDKRENAQMQSVLVNSDDEMGDAGERRAPSEPQEVVTAPLVSKKRKRVMISDDEDEHSNNSDEVVAPVQVGTMRQSASPGVSPVRPKKKISRIIDSDEEDEAAVV